MPYATLPDRGCLLFRGDDALPFLQGLVSNDVLRLPQSGLVYTAMLTPQGKFLHDFFLLWQGDGVLVDVEKSRMTELQQRLLKYRLRSKVTIEALDDAHGVTVVWGEPDSEAMSSLFHDPRLPALGWRLIGEHAKALVWCQQHAIAPSSADAYDLHRLTLGVPEGGRDMIPEKSFLLPFGMEYLHGVDFKKGCYVGQEVTARSKHLGQIRKHIFQVEALDGTLPASGTPLHAGDILVGELLSVHGAVGLAMLQVEAVEKALALSQDIRCHQQRVKIRSPEWLTFS